MNTNKPERVCIIALHFIDYSVELSRELSRSKSVMLVYDQEKASKEGENVPRRASSRTTLLGVRQSNVFHRLCDAARIIAACATFKPDLVIAHEIPHSHALIVYACLRLLAPLFLVVHDPAPHRGRDCYTARRAALVVRTQRRIAVRLLGHGSFCALQLRKHYGSSRITEIEHGAILRSETMQNMVRRNVLLIGRMEEYKGLDVMLTVCRLMEHRGSEWPVRIAGCGPALEALETEFKRFPFCSIERRFLKRDEMISELSQAACVVLPYTEASQSGIAVAALTNGTPVIASDVGGLPEVVKSQHNGLVVAANNGEELFFAIEAVMTDEALRSHLFAGVQQTDLSWSTSVKRIEADFQATLV